MVIAVTMGDPAGIGPEIAVKAWAEVKNNEELKFVIFGDYETIKNAAFNYNIHCEVIKIQNPNEVFDFKHQIAVFEPIKLNTKIELGRPNPLAAPAILEYINSACLHTIKGDFSAVTTLPISKAPLYEAGFKHKGHTEFVAQLCENTPFNDTFGPIMMLMIDNLKVALVTIHIPLKDVATQICQTEIIKTLKVTHEAMRRDFGISNPKLAVLGLNPHAGEAGTLGKEEIEIINPACEKAQEIGIDCSFAMPSDSGFSQPNREKFDCFIAMYHDQGLIPIKALDFWGGVNVTLGLPIIRTSPDHGTGYE
ncbi:MAG: 4-hydroxythreonine-4-phosphate dehydrogenase PdxA, partial [Caulobacterales bacterium]|nr:4-hydroxythreonine-4-phosphate dehydrogenase PdxA [Caulobacterales bacterium]